MALKVSDEVLKISTVGYNGKGDKLEPEAKPAERRLMLEVDTHSGLNGGPKIGFIPGEVVIRSTAGEVADGLKNPCWSCRAFNNERAQKMLKYAASEIAAPNEKTLATEIAGRLIAAKLADASESDKRFAGEIIKTLGTCEALSSEKKVYFTLPEGCCPDFARGKDKPDGPYKARDKAHGAEGSKLYDKVLRVAQNKR